MIEKKPLDNGSGIEVTFVVPTDRATGPVWVVGAFNGWDPTATPLTRDGTRHATSLVLPPGRYAFRYFSEGAWFNDEDADSYERNEFGGHNCVIDLTVM